MSALSEDEVYVRKELAKIYPQLQVNIRKVCGMGYDKWGPDLLSLAIEMFLEKKVETQLKTIADGKLENFITYIANFQLKIGKTSRFYHRFRKHSNSHREYFANYDYNIDPEFPTPFEDEKSMLDICIEKETKNLMPYEKMLIQKRVQQNWKFTELEELYNIPASTMARDVKRILKEIKNKCKKYR